MINQPKHTKKCNGGVKKFLPPLFGMLPTELDSQTRQLGLPPGTGNHIAHWLYHSHASTFSEMTDLTPETLALLERQFTIGIQPPVTTRTAADGTRKFLFTTSGRQPIETVLIPAHGNRYTLCLSSQAGCRMGCTFCMTGRQGFSRHLSTGEILNQWRSVPERERITNLVFMGMGEPFDNLEAVLDSIEILTSPYGFQFPPRRITVSTVGIADGLPAFFERCRCPLAISVHSPFEDERRKMMPVESTSPLLTVLNAVRTLPRASRRRIFIEYIVFKGLNHSQQHADALTRLLEGIPCRINLIRCHPPPGSAFEAPDDASLLRFRDDLKAKGFFTSIRRSCGQDIEAACGQLATEGVV